MIKKIAAICIGFIFLITTAACQTESDKSPQTTEPSKTTELAKTTEPVKTTDQIVQHTDTEEFSIVPLSERKFIYTNGLNIVDNNDSYKEGEVGYYYKYYPIIRGIKNKDVEEKLNDQIMSTLDTVMKELEQSITKETKEPLTIESKQGSAYVSYNCNNVMFIDFNFYLSANSVYRSKTISQGYDLNTGNRLKLEDLFVKNSNYRDLINDSIVMHIIENNFDDPETEVMKKPFQGIRENQSFSFGTNSLRIIIDEKNDEFVSTFYSAMIEIPLQVFEDILVIFDKYYNKEINLFEKEPLKCLMPNMIEYKETKIIEDYGSNYSVHIRDGEFKNVNNEEAKGLLDELTKYNLDSVGLMERLKANKNSDSKSGTGHYVYHSMNSGGYISAVANDWIEENGNVTNTWRTVNYDFNKNKPMKLKDLFIEDFDYKAKIAKLIVDSESYQLMDGSRITKEDFAALSEDIFNFSEGYVSIIFEGVPQEKYGGFVTVEFNQIGMENIALYD
ncbi:MAG: hypothetical protein BWY74_01169 [Firmicutes bacterium ADurb.Bin419]|nr:MAG: hypothetical protein BWY74_01169 [Firmicutes bacterium ADurb.Bin419]